MQSEWVSHLSHLFLSNLSPEFKAYYTTLHQKILLLKNTHYIFSFNQRNFFHTFFNTTFKIELQPNSGIHQNACRAKQVIGDVDMHFSLVLWISLSHIIDLNVLKFENLQRSLLLYLAECNYRISIIRYPALSGITCNSTYVKRVDE